MNKWVRAFISAIDWHCDVTLLLWQIQCYRVTLWSSAWYFGVRIFSQGLRIVGACDGLRFESIGGVLVHKNKGILLWYCVMYICWAQSFRWRFTCPERSCPWQKRDVQVKYSVETICPYLIKYNCAAFEFKFLLHWITTNLITLLTY